MFVTVQFKNKDKVFRGKTYDYELSEEEVVPERNSIIRMLDEDYNYICNGTRVKVVDIKDSSISAGATKIRYISTTLDD